MSNIRTSSFIYKADTADEKDQFQVSVNVKDLYYSDGKQYMDISFMTTHPNTTEPFMIHHPFYGTDVEDYLNYEGEIIAKNPMTSIMVNYLLMDDAKLAKFVGSNNAMTRQMIRFLLMEDDELQQYSGAFIPQDYKQIIQICLSKFTNNTTPQNYKRDIAVCIHYFWD